MTLFCWFNPAGFDSQLLTAFFILGFDMMGIVLKLAVFSLNFAFPVFGERFTMFSWALLFMFMSELIMMIFEVDKPYEIYVKPIIVLGAAFPSIGFQAALVIAGIDLLINLTDKIKHVKRKR